LESDKEGRNRETSIILPFSHSIPSFPSPLSSLFLSLDVTQRRVVLNRHDSEQYSIFFPLLRLPVCIVISFSKTTDDEDAAMIPMRMQWEDHGMAWILKKMME